MFPVHMMINSLFSCDMSYQGEIRIESDKKVGKGHGSKSQLSCGSGSTTVFFPIEPAGSSFFGGFKIRVILE